MKNHRIISIKVLLMTMLAISLLIIAACNSEQGQAKQEEQEPSVSETAPKPPSLDIHAATLMGDLKAVQQHIKAGTDLNVKEPAGGSTPLITAIVFDKAEVAKALIDAGADLNATNNDGSTPLYCAAFFGRPELVQILVDKGADKSVVNNYGSTALQSVSTPFQDVKAIYDQIGKDLGPLGFKLDYAQLEEVRPRIAEMLK